MPKKRHLSVATVLDKNRIASGFVFLSMLEIDVIDPVTNSYVETLRMVNNNENIVYQGETYLKSAFDLEVKVESGSMPEIDLNCVDYTLYIQEQMQAYGGAVGFEVRVMLVNSGNLTQSPEINETFKVISSSANNYSVTLKLGADNPLVHRFPSRFQFRDRCQWQYKSAECGYVGATTTCDFSLGDSNGCITHSNSLNFGGFPGIKSKT